MSLSIFSMFGLVLTSTVGVVVAGAIALIADLRRRDAQRLLDGSVDADAMRAELARMQEEIETRRQQLKGIDDEAAVAQRLAASAERLRHELAELERQKESLASSRAEADSLRAEKASLKSELTRHRELQSDAESRARVADQQAAVAEARVQVANDRKSELDSAIQGAIQRMEQLDDERTAADSALHGARATIEQADDARAALHAKQSQLQALEQSFASASHRLADLESAIQKSELTASERHAAVAELEHDLATAKDILGRAERVEANRAEIEHLEMVLRERSKERTALEQQFSIDRAEHERLQSEIAHLCARSVALKQEVEQPLVDANPETVNSRLVDVWKKAIPRMERPEGVGEELDALDMVSKHLADHQLQFHQRTVYAFHTALKVANEAPLLVLAGISGTGKSLLPQRYSEAMGMNFLLVPVQPRWDGPQDLIGFYNFLQNKLVATEFLRALVQMHGYPDDWKQDGIVPSNDYVPLNDQVLLVLLDEMNLARVEYYFSEFLSRLEIRRTISDKRREDRNRAAIQLDVGPLPSGMEAPRVYPGLNTLFVGTMNEDESTQSLSDKVVDRANVMRFARPKSVQPGTIPSVNPPNRRIGRDKWLQWSKGRQLSDVEKQGVTETAGRLNDHLARAGRPFGHRLTQAMLRYVENYPDGPSTYKHALADQIEMRILPRMRGADMDEHAQQAIEGIQEEIEKLGDEELLAAMVESRDNAAGSRFMWSGVSRSTS